LALKKNNYLIFTLRLGSCSGALPKMPQELSIKDFRSQEGERVVYADILRTRKEGVLQMRMSVLFGAKIIGFFEIYGVSARTRRLSQCGNFADKGGGWSIFRGFVRT